MNTDVIRRHFYFSNSYHISLATRVKTKVELNKQSSACAVCFRVLNVFSV